MNAYENHGGPAFPSLDDGMYYHGMSLRDYFAAQALNGLYSIPASNEETTSKDYARFAYKIADSMLRERKRVMKATEED